MEIVYLPLSRIRPYELNPRINDGAVDRIAESIKTFGFRNPIIVDMNGVIITGHTRYKAAKRLQLAEVPVIYAADMTDDQVRAYRIADNKLGELAEWDLDMLAQELGTLEMDPTLTGFTQEEINKLLDGLYQENEVKEDEFDQEEALEEIGDNPTSQVGQVWQLGRHRLCCGDSTKAADMRKLMDGAEARLIITDPPYNVAINQDKKDMRGRTGVHKNKTIINDNMDDADFYEFLLAAFENMLDIAEEGAPVYVFHADMEGENFRRAFREAGWKLSECLVWAKSSLVLGRQDYHWRHEPCLYGWKEGVAHPWYGGRAQDTILIEDQEELKKKSKQELVDILTAIKDNMETQGSILYFDKPSRNGLHPTMKPLGLMGRLMANSSRRGEAVVDPFGGSGSTLLAAEQLDRKCYIMELDPKYCDVIIKRWEEFTGKTAVKLTDN